MKQIIGRSALLIAGLSVVLASCGGDGTSATVTTVSADTTIPAATTSTTTAVVDATTTSTFTTPTTLAPSNPQLAVQGDNNETVEAFQVLLNCNGFGDLVVDGVFGPATLGAVEAAQTSLGRTVNGILDEETLAELSRSCSASRRLEGDDGVVTVVGNAAPDDPERFQIALLSGSMIAVTVTQGSGLTVTVRGADGSDISVQGQSTWTIDTSQDYLIEVGSSSGSVTFALIVNVTAGHQDVGDWILNTDGVSYRGTDLSLGDDAQTVIDQIFDFLGHSIRGAYGEFDTGWNVITDPQNLGLRGVAIEGFRFLFYGPDPANPGRSETFARHRFVGPTDDADGNPRPDNYATTSEGITVGHALAELSAVYGGQLAAGSNGDEFYYRLTDSGGELCFYFGSDEPTDFSPITEIASECRTG